MNWALSSDQIDMAIICKEAADKFIKYDDKFEIVSPLIKNSDIFLLKKDNPKSIGVTQNRIYQVDLAKQFYKDSKVVPFINSGLAYALEGDKVDGVIVDAIKALNLQGRKLSTVNDREYDTYVLVVNKDFKSNKLYDKFKSLYNKSVEELNNEKILKKELERYTNIKISDKDMGEFKNWKLRFLQIKK